MDPTIPSSPVLPSLMCPVLTASNPRGFRLARIEPANSAQRGHGLDPTITPRWSRWPYTMKRGPHAHAAEDGTARPSPAYEKSTHCPRFSSLKPLPQKPLLPPRGGITPPLELLEPSPVPHASLPCSVRAPPCAGPRGWNALAPPRGGIRERGGAAQKVHAGLVPGPRPIGPAPASPGPAPASAGSS